MDQELKTVNIMLVEDNPADVLLVEKALQEKGIRFQLTCFDAGEKALKNLSQLGRLLPDLILLDLQLPKMTGVDILRAIRNMPRFADVPVVILTSSDSPSDKHRAELLGAARYIKKPSALENFFRDVGCGVEETLRLRTGGR